jgi:hypothetical protein
VSQLSQVPSHAPSQHTPSAQEPDAQPAASVHASPRSPCASHDPLVGLHHSSLAQLPAVHADSQLVVSAQRPVGHGVVVRWHVPAASHAAPRRLPLAQSIEPQLVSVGRSDQSLMSRAGSQI